MERLTEQIATFSQRLTYSDLPPPVIAKAKDLLLDAIGCALGAVSSPPARIAQDRRSRVGRHEQAAISECP